MNLTNNKGFTLVELSLTILFLGLFLYVAIPNTDGQDDMVCVSAARKIMADLRYAQSLAMTSSTSYGLRATSTTTYEIYNVTTNTVATSPYTNLPMSEDLSTSFDGATLGAQNYSIIFDESGTPTTGGGTNIQVNYSTSTRNVHITANSGYISIL